jgi:alkanesulfonate monooxygenase SsuD/methylene tetrahydromethanopterin reductase-like flavin-dependent oxidoreductase (luciferase family)
MQVGVSLIVRGNDATQQNLTAMAKQAEAWGFDSVWASDHLIIPPLATSQYPGSATGQFPDTWLQRYFEPMAVLNYVAGCTGRVRLGTSVMILPMRNPIEVAKEVSLKVRLRFGAGPDPQPPLSGSPEQVIATVKQYQALGVQHLVLDFVPETIDNALATMDRFARDVRPALG